MFTIFTPTYNRAHTLHRVWDSLRVQTRRDFEWLIVDDGSTDDTLSLVEQWRREADFPIQYLPQSHQGKHAAFNRAVAQAQGEYFINLDSDDACLPQTLERFAMHWQSIPAAGRERFSAVVALCVDQHGNPVGDRFPREPLDTDYLELCYRYRIRGEKWGCHRTAVLREFPFPITGGPVYIPERVVWSRIARKYRERCVNEILRVYWVDEPSLVHGRSPAHAAPGGVLEHLDALNEEAGDFFLAAPLEFLRSATHYARFSFHQGFPVGAQGARLRGWLPRLLWGAMLPAGWLVYRRDCQRARHGERPVGGPTDQK
jgi:glycosyltransferase involved in cell wall biosynthesis